MPLLETKDTVNLSCPRPTLSNVKTPPAGDSKPRQGVLRRKADCPGRRLGIGQEKRYSSLLGTVPLPRPLPLERSCSLSRSLTETSESMYRVAVYLQFDPPGSSPPRSCVARMLPKIPSFRNRVPSWKRVAAHPCFLCRHCRVTCSLTPRALSLRASPRVARMRGCSHKRLLTETSRLGCQPN